MNLNFSPPFDPMEQINDDEHDQHHLNFGLNHQIVSSSSSSASCHIFFNSTQDHAGFYHPQLYQPHHHPEDDYYNAYRGRSFDQNKVENGLKLSLWKKGDEAQISSDERVKWMASSKMQKDPTTQSISAAKNIEVVKKVKPSSSVETDDLSSNSSSYNCNTPIRVCSDCHTTKTPLWRSGPKGPKSLCNACGIRQRKARRAMAAAAAANGGGVACDPPRAVKVKVKVKEKIGLKKRCKVASGGSSANSGKKINGLEDFLINLSNKLAFHRMFPQDEKEAAILLMALSSGRVHG
ncbi:hypothetical protein C2S53_017360 [Perilla frutescens var. hirtella]|uniref:GATA-type domain-containing protein n=1 Tax=Perilla frutescens var. hirtella TaxID=608512 RepID=A0AAD4J840_PERFH|nr:hypothetical protein C2S53_017360 [Perilla frutescens var. hirtella]